MYFVSDSLVNQRNLIRPRSSYCEGVWREEQKENYSSLWIVALFVEFCMSGRAVTANCPTPLLGKCCKKDLEGEKVFGKGHTIYTLRWLFHATGQEAAVLDFWVAWKWLKSHITTILILLMMSVHLASHSWHFLRDSEVEILQNFTRFWPPLNLIRTFIPFHVWLPWPHFKVTLVA